MQWKMNNDPCGICSIELVFFIDRETEPSHAWTTFIGSRSTLLRLIKLACSVFCGVTVNADTTGTEMALYFIFILSTDRENAHLSLERNCTNIQQFHYKLLLESYEEKRRINFFYSICWLFLLILFGCCYEGDGRKGDSRNKTGYWG